MLSDENDCSIRDGGQSYFAFQIYQPGSTSAHHLPKPRRACATDPTDDCCASCGESVPASCQPELDDCDGPLDPLDDHINLRCFDQRRRFGIDFLHSVERYSDGLSEDYVPDRNGELVPNPIFSDLDPDDDLTGPRAKSLVFLAGIVGVPWQDIARKNADDQPDLLAGLDPSGAPIGGFQTGVELATGNVWEILIGDPETYTAPSDPFMIESIEPRQGLNPLTGDTIEPPNARPLANSINGHEYDNPGRDDLQFACIFPIEPRDCEQLPIAPSCECVGNAISNRSPLCQDPLTGEYGTVQHYAQSRPAVRQLQVIQAMGGQGLVGSVCVKQIDDELALDFGYRPAVSALGDRLRQSLGNTYCLSQPLPTTGDASGQAACTLIEARATEPGECNCDAAARSALTDDNLDDVHAIKDSTPEATWNCFCGVLQAAGTDLAACQSSTDAVVVNATFGHAVNAWCYVDTAVEPPIGSASLTEACAPEERALRFAGDTAPVPGASAFLVCGSSS